MSRRYPRPLIDEDLLTRTSWVNAEEAYRQVKKVRKVCLGVVNTITSQEQYAPPKCLWVRSNAPWFVFGGSNHCKFNKYGHVLDLTYTFI